MLLFTYSTTWVACLCCLRMHRNCFCLTLSKPPLLPLFFLHFPVMTLGYWLLHNVPSSSSSSFGSLSCLGRSPHTHNSPPCTCLLPRTCFRLFCLHPSVHHTHIMRDTCSCLVKDRWRKVGIRKGHATGTIIRNLQHTTKKTSACVLFRHSVENIKGKTKRQDGLLPHGCVYCSPSRS